MGEINTIPSNVSEHGSQQLNMSKGSFHDKNEKHDNITDDSSSSSKLENKSRRESFSSATSRNKKRDSLVLSTSFVHTRSKMYPPQNPASSKSSKFPPSIQLVTSTPSPTVSSAPPPQSPSQRQNVNLQNFSIQNATNKPYSSPITSTAVSFKSRRNGAHRSFSTEGPLSGNNTPFLNTANDSTFSPFNLVPMTPVSATNTNEFITNLNPTVSTPARSINSINTNLNVDAVLLSKLTKELSHLENELTRQRKIKQSNEKIKSNIDREIPTGKYNSDHIENYSLKLKTNDGIRENDKNIKKLELQIQNIKAKLNPTHNLLTNQTNGEVFDDSYMTSDNMSEKTSVSNAQSFLPIQPRRIADDEFSSTNSSNIDMSDELEKNSTNKEFSVHPYSLDSTEDSSGLNNNETWLVSDYLQSLNDARDTSSKDYILSKANALVDLIKKYPSLKNDLVSSAYIPTIQTLLLSKETVIVAAGYRISRHLLVKENFLQSWTKSKLEIFLLVTFSKNGCFLEKEQAFKLLRFMMEMTGTISLDVIQSCIAFLEKTEDLKLQDVCIELLLEMCYLAPETITKTTCVRTLEMIVMDNPNFEISKIVLYAILDLMSHHESRKFYIKYFSIQFLFAPLTSFYDSKDIQLPVKLLQRSVTLLSECFKQYSGLMLFASNDFQNLRELIGFFKVPSMVRYLVDLFLDILRVKPLSYFSKTELGSSSYQFNNSSSFVTRPSRYDEEIPTVNQYTALLVKVLLSCDFHVHLKYIIASSHVTSSNVAKCRYLLSEFYSLASNFFNELDLFNNYKINIVDKNSQEYHGASEDGEIRSNTKLFLNIAQYSKVTANLSKGRNTLDMNTIDPMSNIRDFANYLKNKDLEQDVSESIFKKILLDTKVLQTKNYALWNWNILLQLFKGPLLTKKRLEELNRNTKFIRRLLVFYRPLRLRFSGTSRHSKLAAKIINTGCEFFKMLTRSSEGMRIWDDDLKILPQIATCLFKAMEGQEKSHGIFSKNRLDETLSSGYFKIIGALTETPNGVKLLEKWNIFTVIYKMFKPRNIMCEIYLQYIIKELYLWESAHAKLILSKALVHSNEKIRILATKLLGYHLGVMEKPTNFINDINNTANSLDHPTDNEKFSPEKNKKIQNFLIGLLVKQFYDLSSKVVAISDRVLYLHCMGSHERVYNFHLDDGKFFVECLGSAFEQLIFIGSPILFQFLSTNTGFKKLDQLGYIDLERKKWLDFKNLEYVSKADLLIENELSNLSDHYSSPEKSSIGKPLNELRIVELKDKNSHKVQRKLPLHFYEFLALNENGLRMLTVNGDFISFLNTIRHFSMSLNNSSIYTTEQILRLKAALWCVGFIGSTKLGISMLESHHVVEDILKLSYECKSINIKFTSFYVLGLICKTDEGNEIVNQFGWDCFTNIQGRPYGLCIPNDVSQFLKFPEINQGAVSILENHFQEDASRKSNLDDYIQDNFMEGPLYSAIKSLNSIPSSTNEFNEQVSSFSDTVQRGKNSLTFHANKKTSESKNNNNSTFLDTGVFKNEPETLSNIVGLGISNGNPEFQIEEKNVFPLPDMNLDRLLYMSKALEDPNLLYDEELEFTKKVEKNLLVLENLNSKKLGSNSSAFTGGEDIFVDRIVYLVSQLNNHLTLSSTTKELTSLHHKKPYKFEIPEVTKKVLEYMSSYKYTFQIRQLLCDTFLTRRSIEALIKKDKVKKRY